MTIAGTYEPTRRGSRHNITREDWLARRSEFVPRGEALPHAKLTDAMVRAIRAEYVPYSKTHGAPALAKRYGLHRRTVEKVLSYETWFHVR